VRGLRSDVELRDEGGHKVEDELPVGDRLTGQILVVDTARVIDHKHDVDDA
jgi:hypothetical protein